MSRVTNPLKARLKRTPTLIVWLQFIAHYERFTDLLCAAAKNGCDDQLEDEYRAVRRWFVAKYHRVSGRLRPYLTPLNTSKRQRNLYAFTGKGGMRSLDVFETIFSGRSLDQILESDNGKLILLVSQLSEAVYECDQA